MDDIVVIILTILIAVVGALSQRKKRLEKEQATKAQSIQQNQPVDIWQLLREQATGHHPFDEEEIIEEEIEPVVPVDNVPEKQPVYQFRAGNEASSDIQKSIMEEPIKKRHRALIDGEKFSLKKAVIYSEIMNRKYT